MTNPSTMRHFLSQNNGCIPVSEWTTGYARQSRRKTTPDHCEEMDLWQAARLPGLSGTAARRIMRDRPRVQRVVVVTDRRAANRLAKRHGKAS